MKRRADPDADAARVAHIGGRVQRLVAAGHPRPAAITHTAVALSIDRGTVAYCDRAVRRDA